MQSKGDALWQDRTEGILNASHIFFNNNVMEEQACENVGTCNTDQLSFKAYFSGWLAATKALAPFTSTTITNLIATSAKAAAAVCNGGASGTQCGFKWTAAANDGSFGIGQQMSALGIIQSAMVTIPGEKVIAPVTNSTGGTSVGDASAGVHTNDDSAAAMMDMKPASMQDKVAASFLTVAIAGSVIGGSVFMVLES